MTHVEEALKGTKYEGLAFLHVNFESRKVKWVCKQGEVQWPDYIADARNNAALAQHAERLAGALQSTLELLATKGGHPIPEKGALDEYRALVAEIEGGAE